MPRTSSRRNHPSSQQQPYDDGDDDDYGAGYRTSPSFLNQPAATAMPDEAYESDGGWSDDSGKDSDAYVESHSGRGASRMPQSAAAEIYDATNGSGSKTSSKKSAAAKKLSSRKIASFFTTTKKDHSDDDRAEFGDDHDGYENQQRSQQQQQQQQSQSNFYHNNYYHDPPPPPAPLHQAEQAHNYPSHNHPVIDQAATARDPASRAALAAGYAAAEYDNDHTVTHEQMELEHQQQFASYDPRKDVRDLEAPDGKTFRSTALTEAETRLRYTLACLIIGLTVAVVIVAGLVGGILGSVVFSKNKNDNAASQVPTSSGPTGSTFTTLTPTAAPVLTIPPTNAPTPVPLVTNQDLFDSIVASSSNGEDLIMTDGTPQNLAFVSVQDEDLPLDTTRLLQRYALRVFYYSTSGPTSWIDNSGWETSDDECSWFTSADDPTTVCSSDSGLLTLELDANGVTGTLPEELGMLTGLTRLYIKGVAGSPGLTGAIPESLAQLTSMGVVVLNDHQFASPLPASVLSAWTQLSVINIIGSDLTGSIPSSIGSLSLCSNFLLDSNALTGAFPSSVGSMSSLVAFGVSNNQLTGTLPALSIPTMKTFNVSSNLLTGALPSFAGMSSLVKLSVEGNTFTGSLDMCGSSATTLSCDALNCTCATCSCV